jgi:hypothetical protein
MKPSVGSTIERGLKLLGWGALALGLAVGLLSLPSTLGPGYEAITFPLLGLLALAFGCLVGQALRPLERWRPPVPADVDAPLPEREGLGGIWLRGFAAGFWALVGVSVLGTLGYGALIRLPGVGGMVLAATREILLLMVLLLLAALPLAMARGMVIGGLGLRRSTLWSAAAAAFAGGLGLFVGMWMLAGLLQAPGPAPGLVGSLAGPLAFLAVPVAAAGTPFLARAVRPSLRGIGWFPLGVLLGLAGAWLLSVTLGGWIVPFGLIGTLLWLLLGCLLWGGSVGSLGVVAAAYRRAVPQPTRAEKPRRARPLLWALALLGLCLAVLLPVGLWLAFSLFSTPTAPVSYAAWAPDATQPGFLPLAPPIATEPAAGVAPTGPVWTFRWRPPAGVSRGQLYQFALWAPGSTRPLARFVIPGTQASVEVSPAALREHSGAWTWRVRAVELGRGAGDWSEPRRFTPSAE